MFLSFKYKYDKKDTFQKINIEKALAIRYHKCEQTCIQGGRSWQKKR